MPRRVTTITAFFVALISMTAYSVQVNETLHMKNGVSNPEVGNQSANSFNDDRQKNLMRKDFSDTTATEVSELLDAIYH